MTPFALRDEMKSQVKSMLSKGVIRESTSPWSAPAILVPKRTMDGKPKYRFCVERPVAYASQQLNKAE